MINGSQITMIGIFTYKRCYDINFFFKKFTCINMENYKFLKFWFFNKPPKKAHP